MKEVYLYKKLENKKVKCLTCSHYCVIKEEQRGICGVRKNINGKLYSLVYAKAAAVHIDPIEKKPLYHFLPGTSSLSLAAMGCNFRCRNCQNWQISQAPKESEENIEGEDTAPEKIVEMAVKNNLPSISYTYTEPTVFLEYALDTMKIAREKGLKNIWVTDGFLSKEALALISPCLDAANVDLKGFSDEFYRKNCGGRLEPILETLKSMKKKGIWLEITTLVIPGLNDDEKTFRDIANFIKNNLGAETPWHISQFSAALSWQLAHLKDTPIKTLEKAYQIWKKAGLKYVYVGNIFGHKGEDTYCPKCGEKVIERTGYQIERRDKKGKCRNCGEQLDIIE